MSSLALRVVRGSCPHCLGDADSLVGEAAGFPFRIVRCPACGDSVAESTRCALCDAPADRFAVSRPLRAVYACSDGCAPFALDAMSEDQIRRGDYAAARDALRARLREETRRGTHPVLITARIVEDYRSSLLDEEEGGRETPAAR